MAEYREETFQWTDLTEDIKAELVASHSRNAKGIDINNFRRIFDEVSPKIVLTIANSNERIISSGRIHSDSIELMKKAIINFLNFHDEE